TGPLLYCSYYYEYFSELFSFADKPASTKSIPLKLRDSKTPIHSLKSCGACTVLGMCNSINHRRIIKPESAAANFLVWIKMIPVAAANKAMPQKYAQKVRPGM